jgi:DNA-binding YbaB/EbfC family protein
MSTTPPGGGPPFDLGAMMAEAQKMQQSMVAAQERAKTQVVEASVGGGMITVQMTGGLEVRSIKIDPAVIDPKERGMLEDLVAAAVNQAIQKAQQVAAESVQRALGPLAGMGLPGLF